LGDIGVLDGGAILQWILKNWGVKRTGFK